MYLIENFPSCCGLKILHELGGFGNTVEELQKELDGSLSTARSRQGPTAICAVTNEYQTAAAEALQSRNFYAAAHFRGSGNNPLVLWMRQRDGLLPAVAKKGS